MNKTEFDSVLSTVSPALSSKDFIPILTCFCFDEEYVYAYDDLVAIRVQIDKCFEGAAKGNLLQDIVGSLTGESIAFSQKKNEVQIRCGKSDIKLPVMDKEDFVFSWPEEEEYDQVLPIDESFFSAISACLLNCSSDTSMPSIRGITVHKSGDEEESIIDGIYNIDVNSTDRVTVTRIKVPLTIGDGDVPNLDTALILPTDFCKALVGTAKKMEVNKGTLGIKNGRYVIADLSSEERNCQVFSKLAAVDPVDFDEIINRLHDDDDEFVSIPTEFFPALQRADLLMGGENASCEMTVNMGKVTVHTQSGYGDVVDKMPVDKKHPDIGVDIDPEYVLRALNQGLATSFLVKSRSMLFSGDNYIHLIANKAT